MAAIKYGWKTGFELIPCPDCRKETVESFSNKPRQPGSPEIIGTFFKCVGYEKGNKTCGSFAYPHEYEKEVRKHQAKRARNQQTIDRFLSSTSNAPDHPQSAINDSSRSPITGVTHQRFGSSSTLQRPPAPPVTAPSSIGPSAPSIPLSASPTTSSTLQRPPVPPVTGVYFATKEDLHAVEQKLSSIIVDLLAQAKELAEDIQRLKTSVLADSCDDKPKAKSVPARSFGFLYTCLVVAASVILSVCLSNWHMWI